MPLPLLLLTAAVFLSSCHWSTSNMIAASDNNYYQIYLDPSRNVKMRWKVDYDHNQVYFHVVNRQPEPLQWTALGFSHDGNESNADLCILWWDQRNQPNFQDVWTDAYGNVNPDKKQDCKLFELSRRGDKLSFSFSRAFDTCDDEDYVIDTGTVHVIYAKGRGPLDSVKRIRIGDAEHGFQRAQLLKVPSAKIQFPTDTVTFSVLANKVRVPDVETTYWCHIVRMPPMTKPKHVIQFEAVIEEGHEALVHHMEVFHCEVEEKLKVPYYSGSCSGPERPKITEKCKKVIAAWAMGAKPFVYPEEAGQPIGGPKFSPYVMLEVHYNNPQLKSNYVDSSGIRLFYTSKLRSNDAAVLEVGLEYSNKMAIPPMQAAFPLSGHCISQCTEVSLPAQGITLFAAQLHTHLTGKQVFVKHFRSGFELNEVARDDHYSPHFQEIRTLRNRVLVLPGDALVTTCVYDTSGRTNITLGGYAISEEMCVSYIHYFPKSNLEVCKSSIDSEVLGNYFNFENRYENQPTLDDNTVAENYQSIEWTPLRAKILGQLYEETTLSMQCNQSSGARFPGYWNNMPQTKILWPQQKMSRLCEN